MPNTGIEPAILRSLARHSNQVSYAAAGWVSYTGWVKTTEATASTQSQS